MKLWVGILFLVVSSQLGINARPIPRPIAGDDHFVNDQQDFYGENSLETQPREQEDHNDEHRETDHGGEEMESIGQLYGSVKNGRGMGEDNQYIQGEFPFEHSPFHYRPIFTDTTYQEDITAKQLFPSHEKHLGNVNKRADDNIMDEADANNANFLETKREEEEDNIDNKSDTERDKDESEFIGKYRSVRNGRGVVDEDEDANDYFPLKHSSHHFRPIYTDTTHGKDEKHFGMDNKKVDGDTTDNKKADGDIMDDKADANNANVLETQCEEEEDNIDNTETERQELDESEFSGKYGSNRNFRGVVEEDEDANDDFPLKHSSHHFGPIYTDTIHREDEKHLGTSDKKVDGDTIDDIPDADNTKSLETQPEEQESHNETEHGGDESKSTGHYHGSAREARAMVENDEDFHDEFPFENPPFHFRPIYTDTTYQEDTAPKHFVPSHTKHLGADNKKADGVTMDDKADANNANFLETQREREEEDNINNHSDTERDKEESEFIGKYGSVRNGRSVVEEDEDANDDFPLKHSSPHFPPIYTDTTHGKDEKHFGMDNKKVDGDTMDDIPDAYNTKSLETQPAEQEVHSETEHNGDEFKSTGYYHGSAKEARGVVEDDMDVHDEFPFEHSPFPFRPIYTDTAYQEDIAPEHFVPSHEKHLGTVNKRADDNILDGKADANNANFLETQREEEGDNIDNNHETERVEDESESIGKYGSVRNGRGVIEEDEDAHVPFKHSSHYFRPIYTDTTDGKDEKHLGIDNKKKGGDTMNDISNADNAKSFETQPEEQEDNETEHVGDEFKSTDHYHGSAKKARGMVENDEDFHDEFPFEHSPFHFRPIYIDNTYLEDTAPEHFFPSHEKHLVTVNKRADNNIMDEADTNDENFLETKREEEEDNIANKSDTERDKDETESIGKYRSVRNGNRRSAKEARGVAEEDEDVHDEFPFEHSPFHFRPIFTDTTYQEDIAPKHHFTSHEKYHGTDNKRADGDIMGHKPDAYSLKAPTEEQVNIEQNSKTEHNVDVFESTDHYHGSAKEARDIVENEFLFEHSPYHFRPIYTDTAYQEDIAPKHSVPSHKKHLGTDNKEVDGDIMDDKTNADKGNFLKAKSDDIVDDNPDAYNANWLEAQPEEQEDNIHTHRETEEEGVESESIGHYGSVRNGRVVVEDNEDFNDGFPFKHSPYYFRPIHTDNTYLDDKAAEHFVPLHEQDHGMDKKKTDTNADNVGFHSHRRVSRKSHENADHETETTYRETKIPEGSKNEFDVEGRVLFEDVDSFGNTYNDVIGLATMYRVTESKVSQEKDAELSNKEMTAEYIENGVHDELAAFKPDHAVDNGKDLMSHDEDKLQEESTTLEHEKDNEDYYQASGGDREKNRPSEWDEDDESDFLTSEGDLKKTETSDWREVDEDGFQTSGRDEDNEDDFLASGNDFEETEASDWNYDDEDEIETSGVDLKETDASEWEEDDEEEFEPSGGQTETNMDAVYDANDSGHYELMGGVAYSGHASQLVYEKAKGVGEGQISENFEQNE